MENINIQYTIKLISPTAYGTFPSLVFQAAEEKTIWNDWGRGLRIPVKSMLQGLTLGTISTTLTCMYFGINPLTGTKMWPKNLGFLNEPSERMLEKGTILDRYGKPTEGRFLSPEGTDFESRSLPSYIKTAEYTRYMVNKPFPVSEGQAAPFYWFNSSGGGTQYYLKNDISYYIEKGYIKIIK